MTTTNFGADLVTMSSLEGTKNMAVGTSFMEEMEMINSQPDILLAVHLQMILLELDQLHMYMVVTAMI